MENEPGKDDEGLVLLRQLVSSTNRTMESHKAELGLHHKMLLGHEKDLDVTLKSLKTHADSINILRTDMEKMADLVNTQSKVMSALQSTMLKVLSHLGLSDSPEAPVN